MANGCKRVTFSVSFCTMIPITHTHAVAYPGIGPLGPPPGGLRKKFVREKIDIMFAPGPYWEQTPRLPYRLALNALAMASPGQ